MTREQEEIINNLKEGDIIIFDRLATVRAMKNGFAGIYKVLGNPTSWGINANRIHTLPPSKRVIGERVCISPTHYHLIELLNSEIAKVLYG